MKYGVYEIPDPNDKEKKIKHLRVCQGQVVGTKHIISSLHMHDGLSKGAILSVLSSVTDLMGEMLANGNTVTIDGLGTFKLQIEQDDECGIEDLGKIHAQHVRVKSVSFQCAKYLRQRIEEQASFERTRYPNRSAETGSGEIEDGLRGYFESHETINRRQFERVFSMRPSTAYRRMRKLAEEGKIVNIGTPQSPVYKKGNL